MLMKLISLVYNILLLVVAGLGCQSSETNAESIRIKPARACGQELGRTLLHLTPNRIIAEKLINEGADVNAEDSFGMTPLHTAVISNRRNVAKVLVTHGVDINAKTHRGQTPLFWAVTKKHKDIAEWLISNGADVNAKDSYGIALLHSAAYVGITDLVELFITDSEDVNVKNNEGRTPLDCA